MNQDYIDTVRLLLAVAPAVFQSPRFAMKGGTALNLFVQDMPRLSVDIDVVFTDHTLDRDAALQAIGADLNAVKSAISALSYRAVLPTTKSGDDVKLLVESGGARVKIEVGLRADHAHRRRGICIRRCDHRPSREVLARHAQDASHSRLAPPTSGTDTVSAEAKRPSLNRRRPSRLRPLDAAGRSVVEQFVNVLRRCGYDPAEILDAVKSATRAQFTDQERMPQTHTPAPELRDAPHIMTLWHADPTYTNSRGRPLPLRLRGPVPSFESLVRRVNRSRPVDEMLRYLTRAGAVEKIGGRHVARMRWVSLRGMQRETSARSLRGLRGMLSNYEHNLLPRDQVESWFEYTAENDRFPRSQEGALADFYLRDCMASSLSADDLPGLDLDGRGRLYCWRLIR